MQSKPIRNSDFDAGTAKHVTFYNEFFKRGRCDLLIKIQRSTRGGSSTSPHEYQKEINDLRNQVSNLEQKLSDMGTQVEDRVRRLELDMLQRIEQVMMAMQQQQQSPDSQILQSNVRNGSLSLRDTSIASSIGSQPQQRVVSLQPGQIATQQTIAQMMQPNGGWTDATQFNAEFARAQSINSNTNRSMHSSSSSSGQAAGQMHQGMPAPSLPPHPKQKSLPPVNLPGAVQIPPDRFNSLRGISTLSRGLSEAFARGTSVESTASAVLMRNSWEDKFFSMLMLDGNENNSAAAAPVGSNVPLDASNMLGQPTFVGLSDAQKVAAQTLNAMRPTPTVSDTVTEQQPQDSERDGDLSSVSTSDMP
jgi:hypothetical protein